ncbi:DUF6625 family protein [Flavobacterium sp.]|uniref:DUF6625 family protein n=1 Tax=Flavobacterium sp. TaxID=239 RepID=UPI0026312A2D|nr:DUF6625 family protein [Flavobacterium sp.]
MNSNNIAIIIPYFGKLPSWFNLFLISASKTKIVTFILFTDDETKFNYPINFNVNYCSFADLSKMFKKTLGQSIYLENPYKICDYRPAFGKVFKDYIGEFSFWGHCDIDIIFGDIDKYLLNANYQNFDRTFTYGHFSIYSNTDKINNAFTIKLNHIPKFFDINYVKKTSYPCNFDEVGMNVIIKESGFSFFEKSYCANVNSNFIKYRLGSGVYEYPSFLAYVGSSVYEFKLVEGEYETKEFMYFHLQNRGEINSEEKITNDFVISHKGFFSFNKNSFATYFAEIGSKETEYEQQEFNKFTKEKEKKNTINKIKREFFYKKGLIFSLLINRYLALKWLNS